MGGRPLLRGGDLGEASGARVASNLHHHSPADPSRRDTDRTIPLHIRFWRKPTDGSSQNFANGLECQRLTAKLVHYTWSPFRYFLAENRHFSDRCGLAGTTEKVLLDYLVQLARLSIKGEGKQVEAYVRRLSRTFKDEYVEVSDALTQLAGEGNALRRAEMAERSAGNRLIPVDQESRWDLLRIEQAPHVDPAPVLAGKVAQQVEQVIRERQHASTLQEAGLEPSRTILFTGMPGVGKTLTAHWIAERLNKPLFTLDLASVMSSLLGKTGTNLRSVLEYAKSNDCVLLLDEFDAVAKRRNDDSEVGELKRLVTVILQEIDRWPADRLLIAATNHGELLDPAVWRRFDIVVEFPLPTTADLQELLKRELGNTLNSAWSNALSVVLSGWSFSDVVRVLRSARRQAVLLNEPLGDKLVEIVAERLEGLPKGALKAVGVELACRYY